MIRFKFENPGREGTRKVGLKKTILKIVRSGDNHRDASIRPKIQIRRAGLREILKNFQISEEIWD